MGEVPALIAFRAHAKTQGAPAASLGANDARVARDARSHRADLVVFGVKWRPLDRTHAAVDFRAVAPAPARLLRPD